MDEGCTCRKCGNKYRVDFLVSDELWEKIKPDKGNLLCGVCIAQGIEAFGFFAAYKIEIV